VDFGWAWRGGCSSSQRHAVVSQSAISSSAARRAVRVGNTNSSWRWIRPTAASLDSASRACWVFELADDLLHAPVLARFEQEARDGAVDVPLGLRLSLIGATQLADEFRRRGADVASRASLTGRFHRCPCLCFPGRTGRGIGHAQLPLQTTISSPSRVRPQRSIHHMKGGPLLQPMFDGTRSHHPDCSSPAGPVRAASMRWRM
jgi:hypothetical protein